MENEVLTPHIHVAVADRTGKTYGGHLFEGSVVKEYVEGTMLRLDRVSMRRMFIEERPCSALHFQRDP